MIRRRLSTIDLLPDAAVPAVQWAYDRIVEERTTQVVILSGLNQRLRQAGLSPISKGAFNRYVLAVREDGRKRPSGTVPMVDGGQGVFTDRMRDQLAKAIGAQAVRQLELTVVALVSGGER